MKFGLFANSRRAALRDAPTQVKRQSMSASTGEGDHRPVQDAQQPRRSEARIDRRQHAATAGHTSRQHVHDREAQQRCARSTAPRRRCPADTRHAAGAKSRSASRSAARARSGGNRIAGKSGHGRRSRPEMFNMRPASHRLSMLVTLPNAAAAGGMTATRKSTKRAKSVDAARLAYRLKPAHSASAAQSPACLRSVAWKVCRSHP